LTPGDSGTVHIYMGKKKIIAFAEP
jgi:hypothetical protein